MTRPPPPCRLCCDTDPRVSFDPDTGVFHVAHVCRRCGRVLDVEEEPKPEPDCRCEEDWAAALWSIAVACALLIAVILAKEMLRW